MEMSHTYLRETLDFMTQRGFTMRSEEDRQTPPGGGPGFSRTRYHLERSDAYFRFEYLEHDAQDHGRYFMEIVRYHGLWTYSLELDSWKWRNHQIEFKFIYHPESARALAFIFNMPPPVDEP